MDVATLATSATPLILAILLMVTALAAVMSAIAISFQTRVKRLPDATKYVDLRQRRETEEEKLEEIRARLRELDQSLSQKDQLIAEIAGLEDRIEVLRAELEGLQTAKQEIDRVRSDAAAAAAEYAEAKKNLDGIAEAAAEKQVLIDQAADRLERLASQLVEKEQKLDDVRRELAGVEETMAPLRAEAEAAHRNIAEARHLEAEAVSLRQTIDDLKEERERASADLMPVTAEIEKSRAQLASVREQHGELDEAVRRLEALKARLERETGEAIGSGSPEEVQNVIGDLKNPPDCIATPAVLRAAHPSEQNAIAGVSRYLADLGLSYSDRTLKGFHTALKINDKSQMTVLAGVSGTGKSLLPRRYCEAMGIHFLQIAVEPRWDSPQDLLGFYNYIEKRYRATDLARLLVHMDPYDTSRLVEELDAAGDKRHDHMALVLLDEMNLARVEYYFSEFLSRLEARPPYAIAEEGARRKDAEIPVDIRGLDRDLRVFPSHNILFAGTMNDDESTQALSDKVLDRSNVLQFAAPKSFDHPTEKNPDVSDKAQSFSEWREWTNPEDRLGSADAKHAADVVETLADIMERIGRPFGHRLRDAIFVYCANYPRSERGDLDVRHPLVDQIEYRIMPKIRGVDIEACKQPLDDLVELIRTRLADAEFANRLEDLLDEQSQASGLLVWRGLTRVN